MESIIKTSEQIVHNIWNIFGSSLIQYSLKKITSIKSFGMLFQLSLDFTITCLARSRDVRPVKLEKGTISSRETVS